MQNCIIVSLFSFIYKHAHLKQWFHLHRLKSSVSKIHIAPKPTENKKPCSLTQLSEEAVDWKMTKISRSLKFRWKAFFVQKLFRISYTGEIWILWLISSVVDVPVKVINNLTSAFMSSQKKRKPSNLSDYLMDRLGHLLGEESGIHASSWHIITALLKNCKKNRKRECTGQKGM